MSLSRSKWSAAAMLRLHVPLVLGVAVCLFAGWVELSRAREGHTIAWVYAFEWPMFAVAGTVMWWRILTDRDTPRRQDRATGMSQHPSIPDDDPGLQEWRRYQAELGQQGPTDESDEVG